MFREINFVEIRHSKVDVFAILGALNFVELVNLALQKVQKSTFRASKGVQIADFPLLNSSKLISCKI